MKTRSLMTLASAVLAASVAVAVDAADRYVDLHCWAPPASSVPGTNRATGITWAAWAVDETSPSVGTDTQSWGHEFPYDGSDASEMHCTIVLPETYDDTGNTPQVTIVGWSIDAPTCSGTGDPQPRYVTLDVSARAYSAGDLANAAWPTPSSTVIENEDCWFGPEDDVRSSTVNATSSSSDWDAGDLVFLRVRRVAGGGWDKSFHVARVRLRLPE